MTDHPSLTQVELIVILLMITLPIDRISREIRVPYTLLLVIIGLVVGFAHIIPAISLNSDVVLTIFLPVLLFAGAWNIDARQLRSDIIPVLLLAIPGLLLSLFIVAALLHLFLGLSWLLALLLGAIISPTDPVAVISLLRQIKLPERLQAIVEGESLFNDGVGAAVYAVVLGLLLAAQGIQAQPTLLQVTGTSLWLIIGGPLLGVIIGFIGAQLLSRINAHLSETTLTFAVAYGAYIVGVLLHTSGLLAVVLAGITLAAFSRRSAMSRYTYESADSIWEFVNYVANSLLFLVLGISIGGQSFFGALPSIMVAVIGVLVGRGIMIVVLLPFSNLISLWLRKGRQLPFHIAELMHPIPRRWRPLILFSGLRGALSLALVLSLPPSVPQLPLLRDIVYGVVLITLLGQGIGLRVVLPRLPVQPSGILKEKITNG